MEAEAFVHLSTKASRERKNVDVLHVDSDASIEKSVRHSLEELSKLPSWSGPPTTKKLNDDRGMLPVDITMVSGVFLDLNYYIHPTTKPLFVVAQTKNESRN